ncbi:MAG: hypothetical protein JHC33_04660 [Ignisphaera sp.]|nr:hypothetical protein [Ignisphaera sp.]
MWGQRLQDIGGIFEVRDTVVELYVGAVSPEKFDDVLFSVQMLAHELCNGHSWGTDGVGYDANKRGRFVSVMKCINKSTARGLLKLDM